jgi:ankyrin repeat protein
VNAGDFDRATPLCALGDVTSWFSDVSEDDLQRAAQTAKRLLDAGADVNAMDRFESTPLHHAAGHGFADVARQLLTHGADVNRRDDTNQTPLSRVNSRFWWSPNSKGPKPVEKVLLDFGGVR